MKKLFSLLFAVVCTACVLAQAPNKMSYQAVIRNTAGNLVTNQNIGMQISILQGSSSGSSVYTETQTPTTNANGLATFEIGGGTVISGSVAGIDWSAGPYFIKTETDPTGGTNYTITGTSELLSVPYALHAADGNWTRNGSTIYNSNAGSVGVGTTSPASKFNVVDNSTINAIEITNQNTAGFSTTSYTNETGGFQAAIGYANSAASLFPGTTFFNSSPDIIIGTQNAERMRITTIGNIGIGTSLPAATLDVAGNVKIADGTQGAGKVLTSDANGIASWAAGGTGIAFKANTTANQNLADATFENAEYPTEDFDDGNNYDPATGIFTAPSAGVYQFNASVMVSGAPTGSQTYMYLAVNGNFKAVTQVTIAQGAIVDLSVATNVKLVAGDQVHIVLFSYGANNTVFPGGGGSGFSGHKVY